MDTGIPVCDRRFQGGIGYLLAVDVLGDPDEESISLYRDVDHAYFVQYVSGPGHICNFLYRVTEDRAVQLFDDLIQIVTHAEAFP